LRIENLISGIIEIIGNKRLPVFLLKAILKSVPQSTQRPQREVERPKLRTDQIASEAPRLRTDKNSLYKTGAPSAPKLRREVERFFKSLLKRIKNSLYKTGAPSAPKLRIDARTFFISENV